MIYRKGYVPYNSDKNEKIRKDFIEELNEIDVRFKPLLNPFETLREEYDSESCISEEIIKDVNAKRIADGKRNPEQAKIWEEIEKAVPFRISQEKLARRQAKIYRLWVAEGNKHVEAFRVSEEKEARRQKEIWRIIYYNNCKKMELEKAAKIQKAMRFVKMTETLSKRWWEKAEDAKKLGNDAKYRSMVGFARRLDALVAVKLKEIDAINKEYEKGTYINRKLEKLIFPINADSNLNNLTNASHPVNTVHSFLSVFITLIYFVFGHLLRSFGLSGCFLNAIGPSFFADSFSGGSVHSVRVLVGSSGNQRNVEFCIEQIGDLSVKFENRVLSLDSKSSCSLKVNLAAKIVLYGVKWAQPDTRKENGDPGKGDSESPNKDINEAYDSILKEIVNPNLSSNDKTVMNKKRLKIIDAIKEVCKSCCCNRKEDEFCIQPTDISQAVKQVCKDCCCRKKESCVKYDEIMKHVNQLCQNCCCKQKDCCNTEGVLSQIGDFCVCLIKDAKEKLENCTCDSCSSCQGNCIDKQKLKKEILKLCSCSEAKKVVEQAAQKCDSCKGSGSCQCCQEAKKQFESCPCMACDLQQVIDEIKGKDDSKCCNNPSCPCSGSDCCTEADVLSALNTYCKCKDQVKQIKEKIEPLCQSCKSKKCCDVSKIQGDIQNICNSCPCKKDPKCCNEDEINSKVEKVIQDKCTCKKNKCCFRDITGEDLIQTNTSYKTEQEKLKNIALAIFKYFRPPIAHSTGVMTLSSETKELCISSSSSTQDNITVDKGNGNVFNTLKIPAKALQTIIASTKITQGTVKDFHPNSMTSINFEEIILSFQELCNEGFKIDGFPIHHDFSMKIHYGPAGMFTRPSANWRNKNSDKSKHELSFGGLSQPQIDKHKCSCSILSDPLFGTVFGAICLTISIVQFIIALFVSQGYYDGFQSYMDAVRSGFSWPTQYDNVASSIFWYVKDMLRFACHLLPSNIFLPHASSFGLSGCFLNAIGPSFLADAFSGGSVQSVRVLVGTSGTHRSVDFCIEQLKQDLSVKFEDRVLSLDSKSSCKLKVSLHAKINLVGSRFSEPDTTKDNGDPEKDGSDSEITDIDNSYQKMLDELVNFSSNDSGKVNTMDQKRLKIINAIKDVCSDCCCNRKEDEYCIKPEEVSQAVKQVCKDCCCRKRESCVKYDEIMKHVNKLCVDCCCKKEDCCGTEGVLSQIGDFCVCLIKDAKEKLENCKCENCSACQENCIDKQKLMKEIEQLCSCDKAKKELEQAAQNCESCQSSSSGTCQCCQEIQKKFKDCSCMACDLKRVIDEIKGSGENGSNCCNSSSCSCSDPNCRKRTDVLDALNTYCKCKDQVKQIKEKIKDLCQSCKKDDCCNVNSIQSDIEKICNSCPCKTHPKCCDESEIKQKVKGVIDKNCTCKKNKCCFNGVQNGTISNTTEKTKLKNIAKNIFKYFRPPIAYETGVMTLSSETKELCISSSSSTQDNITVDKGNGNVLNTLKIPQKAFEKLMASTKIKSKAAEDFHPNSMMSIEFHGITLTFCTLSGEGLKIDGYPINGGFSMKTEYGPAGIFTRKTALWRKKTSDGNKHELTFGGLSQPQIDKHKCSCSILSDPLFGTVFGAICLTISIVQFIIALFVSQGYYDGFRSYMDAVRSGFSWPTQYDNVASSIFWYGYLSTPTLGTYEAVRVLVGSSGNQRNVDFSIEQIGDLSVKFENRLLSLDSDSISCSSSKSSCSLKVSLAAKINLVGSRFSEPDTTKDNGDPDKNGSDSEITDIDNSYQKMLDELVNFSSNDSGKVNTMKLKRKNIIDAIKDVCKDCSCGSNCCFKDINDGNLASHSAEQTKLKNIAKAIFKYFRPPIAYETGVMTLSSETKELCISSSSSTQDNITVDKGNGNVLNTLKIPQKAFEKLMASTKINQDKVKDFHPNSMMSIKFHGITLTFCTLSGEGFCIDGYPIKGGFSMKTEYGPAGIFTRETALWRKKVGENEPKKHDLNWDKLSQPLIDKNKCSCSILSDPLFGTVFGAICLTISIVQFIIALFVSQGYYDGFQSYMDAVRSGFSWPTQYDNVAWSIFWYGYLSTPTLGTYEAVRVLVGSSGNQRNVDFSIEQIGDLSVKFENRLLSLDSDSISCSSSKSSCSLKVSLAAKINLVGSRFSEPDTTKDNGDPDKNGSDSEITDIDNSYQKMLDELVNFSSNDSGKVNTMKLKRKNIIDAIKDVCKDCSCGSNCCFKDINDGNLASHSAEQTKLKNIAKAIFKYFRPPIAYETGVMTLSSETKELCISSSSSTQDNITVDKGNGNVLNTLKIPQKAFEKLMASTKINQDKVKDFHPNSMMSIKFHGITLTFCTLSGEGFCIDGYPIKGGFSMKTEYGPAGIFTRETALWRKKVGENEPKKHDLNWDKLSQPLIDKNKCSCSILSDPLFGTVFGAICLTISIVQFIIALFVSQGYYDGFQSYMDAVRSGFSWPTQYDNVAWSIFCSHQYVNTVGISSTPTLGTYAAVRVLVGSSGNQRNVEFCIEQIGDLSVKFENRVLSLDSKSSCSLKVNLAAKIVLYGVKWAQPDTRKENGDPGKGDSESPNKDINEAYDSILKEIVNPNLSSNDKTVMNKKRLKIIDAIKEVCKSCCCNRKEDEFCIQPTDISQAVKQVCKDCCCRKKESCVKYDEIMKHVNQLCVNCCCKKDDCCGTKEVLDQIEDFCVCLIKEAKGRLDECTCDSCSDCQENCIDKEELKKEILKLCSCDNARIQLENSAQNCSGCSGGSGCECCEAAKKQFESCPCMACDLKKIIENLQGSSEDESKKCSDPSCPCSDPNCRKRTDVLDALKTYCKCKDQVKQIKEKVKDLCKHCNKNKCCDVSEIQSDIEKICNSCPCKTHPKCCNESEINKKVQQVIESKCTCKKFKCCFNGIKDANQSLNTDEQGKLKKIALAIFKYFRPPIAYETGVMTLESTKDIELKLCSSSGNANITVDTKNKNALKIPKQAFKDLMASTKIKSKAAEDFHPNSMMSINFEEIILTFQGFCGNGLKVDGIPVQQECNMVVHYRSAGIFTRETALWRKKTGSKPNEKHDLNWDKLSQPQIDPSKCSCSILSDPLFGTVFGAICLTISIVQFIIALFISHGYYIGFQSYMDAVRSGFSWPTQYDNVVKSVFCVLHCIRQVRLLGDRGD
ncbi:hypothetical protein BdWA1_003483 [Babesia duncani]|uniref:Uncharacterized protein n=1 Tax=Babesia duncani TaxID=323732 RepID=A0AAD9PHX6_9APIC|nr:hypothetical protein BdWA1_003483 [Babesia duncani]